MLFCCFCLGVEGRILPLPLLNTSLYLINFIEIHEILLSNCPSYRKTLWILKSLESKFQIRLIILSVWWLLWFSLNKGSCIFEPIVSLWLADIGKWFIDDDIGLGIRIQAGLVLPILFEQLLPAFFCFCLVRWVFGVIRIGNLANSW